MKCYVISDLATNETYCERCRPSVKVATTAEIEKVRNKYKNSQRYSRSEVDCWKSNPSLVSIILEL